MSEPAIPDINAPATRGHHPACDSRLGPDFEVGDGKVTMTIGICWDFECWDEFDPKEPA